MAMKLSIIAAVVVFLTVIMFFLLLLLWLRKKLMPEGRVTIDINDGKRTIEVDPGSTLLSTLSDNQIFLASACGGGGTCGLCKCQVLDGGGEILPTEKGFFTRREQGDNWRLGCQVKVRQDMKIAIDKSILGVKKWECEVVSNRNVATYIKEFVVKLPAGETLNFVSGGYIQIDVPKYSGLNFSDFDVDKEYRNEWDENGVFGLVAKNTSPTYRAYSMANHPAEGNIIMLNVRIATPPWNRATKGFKHVNPGICSSYIFSLKPGDKITVSGPYGDFFVRNTPNEKMYIGGGAGMAPLRSHIMHLFETEKTDLKVSYWYGARSKREIFYQEDFERIEKGNDNFDFHIALSEPLAEDKWTGDIGFIHKVVYDKYLKNHEAPEDIEYYLCGPQVMTDAVVRMLTDLGVQEDHIMYDDFGS